MFLHLSSGAKHFSFLVLTAYLFSSQPQGLIWFDDIGPGHVKILVSSFAHSIHYSSCKFFFVCVCVENLEGMGESFYYNNNNNNNKLSNLYL